MKKKLSKKGGFTLIELIVVIAILGILAVVAIPRFTGIQKNANQGAIISNLRNIQSAAQIVATETNVLITAVADDGTGTGAGAPVAAALGNWPSGPKGVTYTVVAGDAIATLPASNPPPLPDTPILKASDIK